jgi:hypothetical protein
MADVERPERDDVDAYGRMHITRRGHRIRIGLAKIDLALAGMAEVDKLVTLNEALRTVLYPER